MLLSKNHSFVYCIPSLLAYARTLTEIPSAHLKLCPSVTTLYWVIPTSTQRSCLCFRLANKNRLQISLPPGNTAAFLYFVFKKIKLHRKSVYKHCIQYLLSSSPLHLIQSEFKEPACQFRRHKRCRFDPWVRKIPWRRAQQCIPVFLLGESHGQGSLVGYGPKVCKGSDSIEVT